MEWTISYSGESEASGNGTAAKWRSRDSEIAQSYRGILGSSGLGGRFPKGLTVGYVTEVRQEQRNPLFLEVFLESRVDFRALEEVFVIDPAGPG